MTQYSNSRKQRSESPGTPTLVGGSRPSLRSSCLCGKNQPAIHRRDTKSAESPSEIEKDRIMTGQNHNGDHHSVLMILSNHDSVCLLCGKNQPAIHPRDTKSAEKRSTDGVSSA